MFFSSYHLNYKKYIFFFPIGHQLPSSIFKWKVVVLNITTILYIIFIN